MNKKLPFCECGCGERVSKVGNRFICWHQNRGRKFSLKARMNMTYARAIRKPPKPLKPLLNGLKIKNNSKTATNKNCTNYLGVFIAEQVLSKVFKNVKNMPNQNPGFDFICDKGYKVDVKSSATGDKGYWLFNIVKNKIADYFILIAFNNRKDLNPEHLWLIPGDFLNQFIGIQISKSTLNKWKQYEQSLDKVILCCNKMRYDQKVYKV